ncbi:hypothetical protein LguiA_010734 [Lonicera macranthoides]
MMVRAVVSKTFRSVKPHHHNPKLTDLKPSISLQLPLQSSPSKSKSKSLAKNSSSSSSSSPSSAWSVYLILSTNIPIKTYVGVTTNFPRRLKQHNGEMKGGAKASRSGRPWVCACLIQGFEDKSKACEFESKWKIFSRKLLRKKKNNETADRVDNGSFLLLQHRHAALDKVKGSINCSHLEIIWELDPF